jgi:hypothetical protein
MQIGEVSAITLCMLLYHLRVNILVSGSEDKARILVQE